MPKRKSNMSDQIYNHASIGKRLKQIRLHFGTATLFNRSPQNNNVLPLSLKTFSTYHGDFQQSDSTIQTNLDLGQKKLAHSVCMTCGMAYNSSNNLDLQFHKSYHTNDPYSHLLSFYGSAGSSTKFYCDNSIFKISIHSSSRLILRAKLLWEYLQSDHGFALRNFDLSYSKMQLYVFLHKDINKIVGICFAEEIFTSHRIELNHKESSSYSASDDFHSSKLGICRLWVHSLHRRCNIATQLVDCIRSRFFINEFVPISQISFSVPSPDGIRFALKYTSRKDFLIYLH